MSHRVAGLDLEPIEWNEYLETGTPLIDAQHRMLVDLINRLTGVLKAGEPDQADVRALLDGLFDYIDHHFAAEENLVAAHGYAGLPAHIAQHRNFTARIRKIGAADQLGHADLIELSIYLQKWLIAHILLEDKAMLREVAGSPE